MDTQNSQISLRMKRLVLVLSILVCLAHTAYSQKDFRNGYIITNSLDTLRGLVNYRERGKAFNFCDFRLSKDQPEKTYAPTDLFGYGFINDKFFISRDISEKHHPKEVVFIEVLIQGALNLYKFENTFFVEKNDSTLRKLIIETKEAYNNSGTKVKYTNKRYLGMLSWLLSDCPQLKRKIERVRLAEKELTKLIEEYNQCMGVSAKVFKEKKPWIKSTLGINFGINVSRLKFDQSPQYLDGAFKTSQLPMAGVSVDILSPRISERISFHAGLYYVRSKYYKYSVIRTSSSVTRNYVTLELQQLKIPVGFRYTFPLRKLTPYLTVGISGTLHTDSRAGLTQEIETSMESTNKVETFKYKVLTISDYQVGGWAGVGILRSINKKFNALIEIRYEQTNGISGQFFDNPFGPKSSISNYQVILGIRTK